MAYLINIQLTTEQREVMEKACRITNESYSAIINRLLYQNLHRNIDSFLITIDRPTVSKAEQSIMISLSPENEKFVNHICKSTDARLNKQQVIRALVWPAFLRLLDENDGKEASQ